MVYGLLDGSAAAKSTKCPCGHRENGLGISLTRIAKHRLIFGYIIGALCLVVVNRGLFWPGVVLALLGIGFRMWSAGCIHKNEALATDGPYAMTRNPLYVGSFILGLGMVIAVRSWWLAAIYVIGFAVFYWPTVMNEERYLLSKFGDEFTAYKRRVPAFLPWKPRFDRGNFSFAHMKSNREHKYAMVYTGCLVLLQVVGQIRWLLARG